MDAAALCGHACANFCRLQENVCGWNGVGLGKYESAPDCLSVCSTSSTDPVHDRLHDRRHLRLPAQLAPRCRGKRHARRRVRVQRAGVLAVQV